MILGVQKRASTIDIKTAWRTLVLVHHPDKGGDPEKFKEINRAYEALKDRPERLTTNRAHEVPKDQPERKSGPCCKEFKMEQRKKDDQERNEFLEAKAKQGAEARKAAWQAAPSTVNKETHGSRRKASHHPPADPVVREKAPAAAKVSAKEEDPFWPFFSVFEDAPPEDEMQEAAPAAAAAVPSATVDPCGSPKDKAIPAAVKVSAEEEDPFWSYLLCMMGTVFGCCMNSDRQ